MLLKDGHSALRSASRQMEWWEPLVGNSLVSGPVQILYPPLQLPKRNDNKLLFALRFYGSVETVSHQCTIVDIGLPTESFTFARSGHHVHAFEARSSAYSAVRRQLQKLPSEVQNRVEVHHTTLGNRSGELNIFLARNSSSLLGTGLKRTRKEENTGRRCWARTSCDAQAG